MYKWSWVIFVKKSKFHDAGGPDTVVSPTWVLTGGSIATGQWPRQQSTNPDPEDLQCQYEPFEPIVKRSRPILIRRKVGTKSHKLRHIQCLIFSQKPVTFLLPWKYSSRQEFFSVNIMFIKRWVWGSFFFLTTSILVSNANCTHSTAV